MFAEITGCLTMCFIQIITFFNPDFEDWAFDSRSHCFEMSLAKLKHCVNSKALAPSDLPGTLVLKRARRKSGILASGNLSFFYIK